MIKAEEYFQIAPEKREIERREFIEKAKSLYEELIQPNLSEKDNGKFVAVEQDSGDYFIGATGREAVERAQSIYPEKIFYLARFGYRTAYSLGGLRGNSR